jgi:hypothetical protein
LFTAHVITRPPDFDQILPVVLKSTPRQRELLQTGVRVVVHDRPNNAANRLRRADVVKIVVSGTTRASL